MSTTEITVTGNVVASPSRVRTQNGSVTKFRVAATQRRFDGASQAFVDGASLFIDVECWNELGGNVAHSVSKGDPVVVRGVLRTDEWETETGRRNRTVLRAQAVGLDLSRGTAEFRKTPRGAVAPVPEPQPPAAEDAEERDYDAPAEPLYETDPDTSPAMAHAQPEPALR